MARPKKKDAENVIQELSPRDKLFADYYLIDLNTYKAALKAGYAETVARTKAFQWVNDPEGPNAKPLLYKYIQDRMQQRSEELKIDQNDVLRQYWLIATADPNELTQVRRSCCRYCHGIDHEYQWTNEEEFERRLQEVLEYEKAKQEEDPDFKCGSYPTDSGGYGYNPTAQQNPECPHCFGDGHASVFIGDTRYLSPQAQALYAGVKMTKAGIEVVMHDQVAALTNVARHLGMFKDKIDLNITGNPIEELLNSLPGNTLRPKPQEDK